MDHRTPRDGRPGEAAHIAQGMQAEIVRHHEAAMRLRRAQQPLLHLRLAPQLPALAEQPLGGAGRVLQLVPAAGTVGQVVLALARDLEVDPLVLAQAAHQGHASLLRGEELGGGRHAPALRHGAVAELAAAETAEAAIAAGGAPADRPRLEHDRLDAVLACQMVGCRQAGIAAADDRDIGRQILLQGCHTLRLGPAGGLPIAADGAIAIIVRGVIETALERHRSGSYASGSAGMRSAWPG